MNKTPYFLNKMLYFGLILTAVGFIAVAAAYSFLPNRIPTHWRMNGEINGYSSRSAIFMFPFISLLITLGMYYLPKIDPKRENIRMSQNAYLAVFAALIIFMQIMLAIIIIAALGLDVPVGMIIPVLVGVLFITLSVIMPNIGNNYFLGFRTPWALSNDEVWRKTQIMGSRVFFVIGILFVSGGFLPAPINFVIPMATMIIGVIGVYVYSYLCYKNLN